MSDSLNRELRNLSASLTMREHRVIAGSLAWARMTHRFGMEWAFTLVSMDTGKLHGPMSPAMNHILKQLRDF